MSDIPADYRTQIDLRAVIARKFEAYAVTRIADQRCVYIGITTRGIRRRWGQHYSQAPSHRAYALSSAIKKYGVEAFRIDVIANAVSAENLNALEVILISQYGTMAPAGYNLTSGGAAAFTIGESTRTKISKAGLGRQHTAEAIAKITAASKARPPRKQSDAERQERSIRYTGRKATPETRAKMSLAQKGRPPLPITEKAAERLRTLFVGRKHTPETLAKMSAKRLGVRRTAEFCAAQSARQKGKPGRPLSPAARERLRLANTGRPCSPETRAKIGAANRKTET